MQAIRILCVGVNLILVCSVVASGQDVLPDHSFRRGDSNSDGKVDISDPVHTFRWLFIGTGEPECLDAADSNDEGDVNLTDGIFTLAFLFQGGELIPAPGHRHCGRDPTRDSVSCEFYFPCSCEGFTGLECEAGEHCDLPVGECSSGRDASGDCVLISESCPEILDPVCGCDGRTYDNDCERILAGKQKEHDGPCEQKKVCGGIAGIPCDDGEICELPPGECESADLQGECVPRPDACIAVFDPVCGCDGRTYGNDCERLQAGVQRRHLGECREPE